MGVVSTSMNTAEGIKQEVDLAHADADRAAHVADVVTGGHAAQRGEQNGGDGHAEEALREHVDAKGVVDRARGFLVDERAEDGVDELVEVDDPEADGDGEHQREHLADARVVPVDRELQTEVDAAQRREDHQRLHERRREDRDRVRIDLVAVFMAAVEVRAQHDEQDDDHEVPHRGRDRGDGEVFVGLQDPDEQAGEADEQDDREENLREGDGEGVQRSAEGGSGEQRHDQPRREDEDGGDRAEDDEDDPEQGRGQPEGLALAPLLEQFGEDRHERRGEGGVGKQVAYEVGDLKGDRERRDRSPRPEEARGDDFPPESRHARDAGGEGDDRGVARNAFPAARRSRTNALPGHLLGLGLAKPAVFLPEARIGYADELDARIGWWLGAGLGHTEQLFIAQVAERLVGWLCVWWDLRQGSL